MMATTIRLSMLAALLIGEAAVAEDAQQLQIPELDRGETLEKLGFPAVTERLTGWTKFGKGKVYTLPVKAGRQPCVSPTASTMVKASTTSTVEARKAAKTTGRTVARLIIGGVLGFDGGTIACPMPPSQRKFA